jgi:hypothetical protein
LPGFGIRIMPSGRRFFLVQYHWHDRTRRVMIDQYGPITEEGARQQSFNTRFLRSGTSVHEVGVSQESVVAWTRFELTTFRLKTEA